MNKHQPVEGTPATLNIVCLSHLADDHAALYAIIQHNTKWKQFNACDLVSALALIQQHEIAVVLCERDSQPGTWIDVLDHLNAVPNAPKVIVASRLADDHLWAEAINLGAYDVLAKPFDRTEVVRSVYSAWRNWHRPAPAMSMAAAS